MLCTVDDIPDEQWAEQPGGLTNHPAWVLGHVTFAMDNVTRQIGGTVQRGEAWAEPFRGGTTPTANRSNYPGRDELISAFTDSCRTLRATLRAAGEPAFDRPVDNERLRGFFPTLGRWTTHAMLCEVAFHCGQLSAWRRAKGLASVFENEANIERLVTSSST